MRRTGRSARDRPPTDAAVSTLVGLDIGASKWLATAVGQDCASTISDASGPTGADPDVTLTEIESWLGAVRDSSVVDGLGCAFAGEIAEDGSVTRWPNQPTWTGFPIVSRLHDAAGAAPHVEDDGVCAALGELAWGFDDFLCISFGTGIGSALVLDGVVRPGRGMAAGLGHFRIASQPTCVCGRSGCAQALVSGNRLGSAAANGPGVTDADLRRVIETVADLAGLVGLEAVVYTGGLLAHHPDLAHALRSGTESEVRGSGVRVVVSDRPARSALDGALVLARGVGK